MEQEENRRFPEIDMEKLIARSKMTPGERIQAMMDERERLVGLIRERLREQYPDLSHRELNLKVLEEIERVKEEEDRAYTARFTSS